MPEHEGGIGAYAVRNSESGKASRRELPPEAQLAFLDIQDALADNPDAFPGRTRAISRDGTVRVYSHPSPALQVTYEIDTASRIIHFVHFVAPKVNVTRPVFISYSHKDAKWLDKLKLFLRPLEDQDLIRVWDDTEIQPGAQWLDEIQKALGSARVAVFLVTQDLLNSPFIRDKELPALLEAANNRGCLIFGIAVSSTTFEDSPLARFQGAIPLHTPLDLLPEPEQNELFKVIYQKMKAAVSIH
jgi:TIR domain